MAIFPRRKFPSLQEETEIIPRIEVLEKEIEQLKRNMAELLLIYGVKKEETLDERSNNE